jgi:predicted dehydrogenase
VFPGRRLVEVAVERDRPVRIGLIGYGKGGRFFHAPLIMAAAGCELAGVVTRSAARRGEVGRDFPGTPVYEDLAQLAGAGMEAVAISTPADTHVPLVLQAVSAGLPVVCDKPFAPESSAATRAVQAAERADVPLTVYQNRRLDADLLTVRAVLDSGGVGPGHPVRVADRAARAAGRDPLLRRRGPARPGRACGRPGAGAVRPVRSVYAELDDAGGVPGRFFLALRHTNGVVSHLVGDLLLHGEPGIRFRVFGTDGYYEVDTFDGQADQLLAGGSPTASGDAWGVVPPQRWGRLHTGHTTQPWPSERGDWTVFYAAFANAVRGRGPVPVDPQDAVAGLVVLEGAQQSAQTGQVIALTGSAPAT